MADFSHLKKLEVSVEHTADLELHQISVNGQTPVLQVAPATDANKPFFNSLLKRAGKAARAVKAGAISADMLDENRAQDRELYPRYVIKGWTNMLDGTTGQEIKFSKKTCVEFLAELPDWLFDDIRTFCGNPASFTELMDLEVIAKN